MNGADLTLGPRNLQAAKGFVVFFFFFVDSASAGTNNVLLAPSPRLSGLQTPFGGISSGNTKVLPSGKFCDFR